MAFNLSTHGASSPTVFEQQREELVREIAVVSIHLLHTYLVYCVNEPKGMEQVLQNINRLSRNLESAIAVRLFPV